MIQYLEWDSDFFSKKIYKVNVDTSFQLTDQIERILNELKELKADGAYFVLSDYNEVWNTALNNHNIECFDKKIVFEKKIETGKLRNPDVHIEDYKSSINNELLKLGLESGNYSRFKIDKELSPKFEQLYSKWIENSLNGLIADTFIVYRLKTQIAGMITGKVNNDIATIGLIAAHPNFQGQGIGSELMNAAERSFAKKNAKYVQVATQVANTKACVFYVKCGYHIHTVTPIYHFWA
jgi:dTDP-4-amino-4,6-dideoxy-D-galactose acyltransferase